MEKAQFQVFEDEYPHEDNNNNNNNGLLQPVIPGTNLPIQTEFPAEDVTVAREPEPEVEPEPELEPEHIAWSTTFIEETRVVEPTVPIGPLMTGLQEDPDSHPEKTPPSNYQTKVPDPTGEETRVVEPTVPIGPLMTGLQEDPNSHPEKTPPSNYQTKVPDPTGEGGKEAEVEPLVERLDEFHIRDQSSPTVDQVTTMKSVAEYPRKAAEVLAPVYGKVAAGLSKFGSDKGVSAREYLGEKLRPGEDDKALSEAIFGRFRKKEGVAVVQPVEVGGERSLGVMDRLKGAFKSTTGLGAEHLDRKEPPPTTTTTAMGDVSSG